MFCCSIGSEVGTGCVDNCGESSEGRGTGSSNGLLILCFCFFVLLFGIDDAACDFGFSSMGDAGLFEVGKTLGWDELVSFASGFDGDEDRTGVLDSGTAGLAVPLGWAIC